MEIQVPNMRKAGIDRIPLIQTANIFEYLLVCQALVKHISYVCIKYFSCRLYTSGAITGKEIDTQKLNDLPKVTQIV